MADIPRAEFVRGARINSRHALARANLKPGIPVPPSYTEALPAPAGRLDWPSCRPALVRALIVEFGLTADCPIPADSVYLEIAARVPKEWKLTQKDIRQLGDEVRPDEHKLPRRPRKKNEDRVENWKNDMMKRRPDFRW